MVYRIGEDGGVWAIGYAGLTMYWVIFGCMTAAAITFAALTFSRPMSKRSHGYITTAIVTIAAIAYFAMAAHGGSALTSNPYNDVRDIYYARYIDWFFTTPLLLLDLLLLAGLPLGVSLWILLADITMIILGLFGALSTRQERWGYYGISCCFFFIVLWGIFWPGLRGARAQNATLGRTYMALAAYLAILWFGYPIVWGFAEGSCVISVSAEAISYGILDFFAKVGFGFAVMMSHPVITANPVTSGSVLTNSTNAPFVSSSVDAAEKGTPLGANERGRLVPPGGAHSTQTTAAAPAQTAAAERRAEATPAQTGVAAA